MSAARSRGRCSPRLELTLLALVLLFSSTCSRRQAPGDTTPRSEWSLRVDNHHWLDVTVYVIHGGQRTRIGVVTAATANTFILPPHFLAHSREIRLVASPIGGGETPSVSTEVIVVNAGQMVDWTLERDLRRSSVSVW